MPPKKSTLKELKNAVTQYNNSVSKCQVVLNGKKYEKYEAFQLKLEDKFDILCQAWEAYKEDILDKGKSEVEFNAEKEDSDGPLYSHNDNWKEEKEKAFFELFDKLNDDKPAVEKKVNTEEVAQLQIICQEIKTILELTGNTTIKLIEDVSKTANSSADETVIERVVQMINTQRDRISGELSDKLKQRMKMSDEGVEFAFTKDELFKQITTFSGAQLGKLDELQMNLAYKVKPRTVSSSTVGRSSAPQSSADKVQLAKTKPPLFKGEIVDFPEFKRKWNALVHPANLPAEAELDKLRDAIPKSAKDQLYGCKTLLEAWSIFDKRYGNPELIAKKLKDQLKNITVEGKSDPEKVINLQVRVKTLVMQLSTLNMEQSLQHDSEFLAAVFNCLPSKYQDKWLDIDKTTSKWNDMLSFLDKIYDQATEQLVLLDTMNRGEGGAKKKAIVEVNAATAQDFVDSKFESDELDDVELRKKKEKRKKLKEEIGACPNCKAEHTFLRRDKITWPSDRLFTCKKFKEMSVKERGTLLEKFKGCVRCTSWRHSKSNCPSQPAKCSTEKTDGSKCGKDHSYLVHDSGVAYCNVARSSSPRSFPNSANDTAEDILEFDHVDIDQTTVYYIQDVPIKNSEIPARTFYNEGSNRVLIRDEYASKAGLVRKKVVWRLLVVGQDNPESVEGYMYLAEMVDSQGKAWKIWGYGIDSIMSSSVPDMMMLKKYFPHVPDEALKGLVEKEVDILLGMNMNHLMPAGGKGKNQHQGMRAKTSLFGSGWVLGGCHKDLKASSHEFYQKAGIMRAAKVQVIPESFSINFWESENMGVLPPPKCDRCTACHQSGTCSDRNRLLNEKQQAELDVISEKTKIIDDQIWCDYPFKKDPACLKYNRAAAIKVAEKVERDLVRDGLHDVYNEQVQAILDRGAAVRLTKQEMEEWAGAVNYITHHPVLSSSSASTPVRMVSNSSFGSPSLNSILMKGPNSLNSMLDIMIRWRAWDVVIQYDLAKAYNTMHTWLLERNVRRFVWRFSHDSPWIDFAFDRVHFGDVPAGCQLEVSLHKIADVGREICPVAADKIKHDRYVDDGLTGGKQSVVDKLVGKKQEDGSYDGDLAKILRKGSFNMKAIAIGGQEPNEESDLMGGKVLGYGYDIKEEMLAVRFPVNISKKRRSVRSEPNLTLLDVEMLKSKKLTKRMLLGVTNSFGDFLGIASPFTIRFKVLMRKLFQVEKPLNWDDDIPEFMREAWIEVIREALEHDHLSFHRSTKPKDAIPDQGPTVVGFSDFAEEAFDARVYLRWERDGSSDKEMFSAGLALCKAKVPPLDGLTTPRGELTALCLLSRLVLVVVVALQKLDVKPTSAILLSDSQCSINAVDTKRLMKPYFQHRVSEVKENMNMTRKYCQVEDVHYVESKLNPSDLSTRATSKLDELGPGSFHQCGPAFLCSPREDWPVSRDFDMKVLPEDEFKAHESKVSAVQAFKAPASLLEVEVLPAYHAVEKIMKSSRNIGKVQRILARYRRFFSKPSAQEGSELEDCTIVSRSNKQLKISKPISYTVVSKDISQEEIRNAERILMEHTMFLTDVALEKGHLDSLLPVRDGALIVTQGRLGDQKMLELFGATSLPILMPTSQLAYLYMMDAHCGEYGLVHRGTVSTLARSREKVWVVKGRRLAKKVCEECLICRREAKKLIGQQMSLIRKEQLQVSPPFTHVCLDFAGPIKVTDQVSKRKTLKVWVLIYSCVATKAVIFLATPGYSTQDFLCKHDEFTARVGRPRTIVSDKGSQLMKSSIKVEEKDMPVNSFNWKHVISRDSRTKWIFVPAGGQHRNGLAESTVKVMKKSLNLALQAGEVLVYAEMVTLLARIATSVNSRPLSIGSVSSNSEQEDILMPLTPNHLLLARSTSEPTNLEYEEGDKFSRRMAFVQCLQDEWWKRWIAEVLPTLVPCKKWKKPRANLKPEDIVMVNYPGNMTDDYRLAKVTKVFPDRKKLVRTVEISYRRRNKREPAAVYKSKPLVTEKVHVQKLSLLQSAGEPIWDGETSEMKQN